jgi:hypothetical protein
MTRIVSEVNSGAWQIIVFPKQLLVVEPLNRFIIDPGYRVAVAQDVLALTVNASVQHGGVSQTAQAQQ